MDGMMDHNHNNSSMSNKTDMSSSHKMLTHMTFYWGKNSEILFSGWPGTRSGMYALSLIFIFILSILVEALSRCQLIKHKSVNRSCLSGLVQTLVHTLKIGLAYMVMLALMSFNGGVFLAAISGHAMGYLLFRSTAFKNRGSGTPSSEELI